MNFLKGINDQFHKTLALGDEAAMFVLFACLLSRTIIIGDRLGATKTFFVIVAFLLEQRNGGAEIIISYFCVSVWNWINVHSGLGRQQCTRSS